MVIRCCGSMSLRLTLDSKLSEFRSSAFRALRPRPSAFRALRRSALFGVPRPSAFRALRHSALLVMPNAQTALRIPRMGFAARFSHPCVQRIIDNESMLQLLVVVVEQA